MPLLAKDEEHAYLRLLKRLTSFSTLENIDEHAVDIIIPKSLTRVSRLNNDDVHADTLLRACDFSVKDKRRTCRYTPKTDSCL